MGKAHATSLNREFGYCTLLSAMFTGIMQELGLVRSIRSDALTPHPFAPGNSITLAWRNWHVPASGLADSTQFADLQYTAHMVASISRCDTMSFFGDPRISMSSF